MLHLALTLYSQHSSIFLLYCISVFLWAFKRNPAECHSCSSRSSETASNSDGMWKFKFKFLGAYNYRTLPASKPRNSCVPYVPQLSFWFLQQTHSHLRSVDWIIDFTEDLWEMEDRVHHPAHIFCHLAHAPTPLSILSLFILFIPGCSGSTGFTPLLPLCASQPIFSFSTLLIAKFHQLLSCNLLNLSLLILFLAHHLSLGFWRSHVDYWSTTMNWLDVRFWLSPLQ